MDIFVCRALTKAKSAKLLQCGNAALIRNAFLSINNLGKIFIALDIKLFLKDSSRVICFAS